jgi:hypothetical protein
MGDEGDPFYKRKDDLEWRDNVNSRLVKLTSSEAVQNDRLDDHIEKLREVDAVLHGDPRDRSDIGLCALVTEEDHRLAKIEAVLFRDALGKGGLIVEVSELREGRLDRRQTRHDVLKLITAIIVAAITSGVLTKNWAGIMHYFGKKSTDPVDQMIEKAKHPRGGKRVRVRYVPPPAEEPDLEVDGSADQQSNR